LSKNPWISPSKIQVAEFFNRSTLKH
jgi:hypothetical protein